VWYVQNFLIELSVAHIPCHVRSTYCNCNLQVSVVDELGIPVKFVGVGEGVDDLQPFDAEAFVNAIFA